MNKTKGQKAKKVQLFLKYRTTLLATFIVKASAAVYNLSATLLLQVHENAHLERKISLI